MFAFDRFTRLRTVENREPRRASPAASPLVLIACYEVPGWGGAATAAYALFERMRRDGHRVTYASVVPRADLGYFTWVVGSNCTNPRALPNVHTCVLGDDLAAPHPELAALIRDLSPDVTVAVGETAAWLLKRAAPERRLVLLTTGCQAMKESLVSGEVADGREQALRMTRARTDGRTRHAMERAALEGADLVLANSDSVHQLLRWFYPALEGKLHERPVWFAEWIHGEAAAHAHLGLPFEHRDVDALFVASSWDRPEKNYALVQRLTRRLDRLSVHVVGTVSSTIPGVTHHGLVGRGAIFRLLGRSRTVVSPSLFDAAPGVLFEASALGCNVVASRNCGNWGLCHDSLLVEPPSVDGFAAAIHRAASRKLEDRIGEFLGRGSYADLIETLGLFEERWGELGTTASGGDAVTRIGSEPSASPVPIGGPAARVAVVIVGDEGAADTERTLRSVLDQIGVQPEIVVRPAGDPEDLRLSEMHRPTMLQECDRVEKRDGVDPSSTGSDPEFVARVEAGWELAPGALRTMVEEIRKSPEVAAVFGLGLETEAGGSATLESWRRRGSALRRYAGRAPELRRELVLGGPLRDAVRTYRRAAVPALEGSTRSRPTDLLYEMDLRLADRFEIRCVPELLCWRERGGRSRDRHGIATGMRSSLGWLGRWRRRVILRRQGDVRFLRLPGYSELRLLLHRIGRMLDSEGILEWRSRIGRLARWARRRSSAEGWMPLLEWLHARTLAPLGVLPLRPPAFRSRVPPTDSKRVGYYLWHFPVLSQTFVQREIAGLRAAGLDLVVFAEGAEDPALLGPTARRLQSEACYPSTEEAFRRRCRRRFFTRDPVRYLILLGYVLTRRYAPTKRWTEDRRVFDAALCLAGSMEDAGVGHVHAPWADRCAFIALVASRLLGASFSVQARAHELHSPAYRHPLREIFENASFVVTNSRYNVPHIRSHVRSETDPPIHIVCNGLNLEALQPSRTKQDGSPGRLGGAGSVPRILCVARLIEQKGLVDLVEACRLLRDEGRSFVCEVIGGAEEPLYTSYALSLRRQRRRLGLEDHVLLRGARPFADVVDAYRAADVFVLPCVIARDGRRDITPNALIEAMAMKLAIVSTPVGGVPEIVEDGVSGLLVSPGDVRGLATALARLLEDPGLRRELAENARRRVEERFDLARNTERWLTLFGAVGADRVRPRTLPIDPLAA